MIGTPADTQTADVGTGLPRPGSLERVASLVRPEVALATAVVLAFVAYAALASLVTSPRIFTDELAYWGSAVSLLDGDFLTVRGERYELGPLYPALLAAVLALAPDRDVAYETAKLGNALLFALAAIPTYFLARRVLRPWPSVGVAALAVLVPSSMYVSVVMTESLAYSTFMTALLAIVLALERPTPARQGLALAAIALAATARLQFLVLVPVLLLALVLTFVLRKRGTQVRGFLAELWPTAVALGAAAVALGAWGLVSGIWAPSLLGGYSTLLRDYDAGHVAVWLSYHVANLELYLAVVPLAVAPVVAAAFVRRAREGSARHAAFAALFVSANAAVIALAAAFNSTEYSHERLHDRYTFYLVPLWIVVLFAWLQEGAPRPLAAALLGGGMAIVLPAVIPYEEYAREDGAQRFAGVASTFWAAVQSALPDGAYGSGKILLLTVVAGLVLAAFLLPRRLAGATVAAVVLSFVVTAELAWYLAVRDGTNWAFANTELGRGWIDELVPSGRDVTSFSVSDPCRDGLVGGDGFHRTEFFNERVTGAAHVGRSETLLPSTRVHVARDGRVAFASGDPFVADYVLAQSDLQLAGRRLAEGTTNGLVLWRVEGPVRLTGIGALGQLNSSVCRSPG